VSSGQIIYERLSDLARKHSYFFAHIWKRSWEEFGPQWAEEIADNVVRLFGLEEDGGWVAAIQGYAEFALDAMRNQKFFEANGRYRWSTLGEIQSHYYDNKDHMMRNYLPGMYLSHYLWPHHFKLLTFFRAEVLRNLGPAPSVFCDVGIGTGMYSREVLCAFPHVRGKGFDISQYSVAFTRNVLQAYGVLDRYEFVIGDIFATEPSPEIADLIVSQEVLEHLEDPERFCRILYELTKIGGKGYVTAAVNAGHSDHIYLFRSPEDVESMLMKVGWRVVRSRAEYAYEGKPIRITPCVAAFVCEK
jgi:SAM-dependent methyltransferase